MMLSPAIYLLLHGLFFTLRLSGGGGSFPRPLKAEEEREYLRRWAQGDLEARNKLVEHNLRLVAHIVKKYYSQSGSLIAGSCPTIFLTELIKYSGLELLTHTNSGI